MGDNRHGKDGGDLIIKVPPGTQIMDDNENVIADLVEEGMRCLVATGGVGGRGNTFFKTSTHQTPRFAQPGMPGDEKFLVLNLKLIADIGLVGLPNAGKSTLLSRLTNARPKSQTILSTLVPNLGVVERNPALSIRSPRYRASSRAHTWAMGSGSHSFSISSASRLSCISSTS